MVRLHFQARPWDLYAAVSYSALMTGIFLVFNVGDFLGIVLVLFVPGYVVVALLFPSNPEIGWIERIVLSSSVSVSVVPLLGLLQSFTPWGIGFASVAGLLALFVLGVGYVAYWRRMRLPADKRLAATLNLELAAWQEYPVLDKVLTITLTASIVVVAGTLAYVVTTPRPQERFTEFYLLGPGGNASVYPTNLTVNETGGVIIGVVNHEVAIANYTVRIDLVGVRLVYNATSGFNETVEVNRTTWSTFNVTLADGRNWTRPYTFRISDTGLWKVQFLLFKGGDTASVYRELHLFIRVT